MVEVIEAYREWTPPSGVTSSIEALLGSIPPRYLVGLRSVILTNTEALDRKRRQKKFKSIRGKAGSDQLLGLYHPPGQTSSASIELFVDKILGDYPRWALNFGLVRETLLASTLFHEVGHHVHRTQKAGHGDNEAVADAWVQRLGAPFFRRKYWYLLPVHRLIRGMRRIARRGTGFRSPAN